MDEISKRTESLKLQITAAEKALKELKEQLAEIEGQQVESTPLQELSISDNGDSKPKWPLSSEEYKRYGRQMIVPDIGIQGASTHHV